MHDFFIDYTYLSQNQSEIIYMQIPAVLIADFLNSFSVSRVLSHFLFKCQSITLI